MPKIPAHRNNQRAGWVVVPPDKSFDWTLRLQIAPRTTVAVPVRTMTRDRGWTHYYFADLDVLSPQQLELLAANKVYEPAQEFA